MFSVTLTPNRSTPTIFTKTVKYLDYMDVRVPERRLQEVVDGRLITTRITELPYGLINRECYSDASVEWPKLRKVTRAELIAQGLIKVEGDGMPYLKMSENDWNIAMNRCAGLDSGEIEPFIFEPDFGDDD
jgi:hypothetical protein